MLSKTHFSGAVKRLQAEFTPSHMITMLKKALSKNADTLTSEESKFLSTLEQRLDNQIILDRKRAENYLSKSLYAQNYPQIVHIMKGDKDKAAYPWKTSATKHRLYGAFLETLEPDLSYDSYVVEKVIKEWGKILLSISIDGFHISHTAFNNKFNNDEFGVVITHGAMSLQFSNINIDCEVIFSRNNKDYSDRNFPQSPIANCKINNKTTLDYLKGFDPKADLDDACILDTFLALFVALKVDNEAFYEETDEYSSIESYLSDENFDFKMKDMKLSDYSKHAIQDTDLLYSVAILKDSYADIIYDGQFAYAPSQRHFDIKASGWTKKNGATLGVDRVTKGILTLSRKNLTIEIEYHFIPFSAEYLHSEYFKLTVNGEILIEENDFSDSEMKRDADKFIYRINTAYKIIQLIESNK